MGSKEELPFTDSDIGHGSHYRSACMSDPKGTEPPRPESEKGKIAERSGAGAPTPGQPDAPKKLTPEEQMELYERELKENDWGHQPC